MSKNETKVTGFDELSKKLLKMTKNAKKLDGKEIPLKVTEDMTQEEIEALAIKEATKKLKKLLDI